MNCREWREKGLSKHAHPLAASQESAAGGPTQLRYKKKAENLNPITVWLCLGVYVHKKCKSKCNPFQDTHGHHDINTSIAKS